jgi:hypothetical protein
MSKESLMDNPIEPVLGMPVHEVVAYLTEIATYHQMMAERLCSQIDSLSAALAASVDASTLADSSNVDAS